MSSFLESVANVLDAPDVTFETAFRSVPGWCSLYGFGLLVLLENDCGAPVAIDEFQRLETVRDLARVALLACAAKVFGVPRESLSGRTAIGSIPEWDSVNHLRLVMEAERLLGTHYALERIPELKTLDDFLFQTTV